MAHPNNSLDSQSLEQRVDQSAEATEGKFTKGIRSRRKDDAAQAQGFIHIFPSYLRRLLLLLLSMKSSSLHVQLLAWMGSSEKDGSGLKGLEMKEMLTAGLCILRALYTKECSSPFNIGNA
ncbi:hypothetical protein AAC387_Pa06g1087 [Persea americana]